MLDFNNEAEQKNTNYGPVPAGSKVMVSITVETPKYSVEGQPLVSQAKSGLRGLWCKFTVVGGAYDEVSWYDNLWLPAGRRTAKNLQPLRSNHPRHHRSASGHQTEGHRSTCSIRQTYQRLGRPFRHGVSRQARNQQGNVHREGRKRILEQLRHVRHHAG